MSSGQSQSQPPPSAVDLSTLTAQQLSQLQQRLSQELEHLTQSHTKLRLAQQKFRECIKSIETGVRDQEDDTEILVPLTTSLYVPGRLADRKNVIVDVGTGFYVEKETKDAVAFYKEKVDDLGKNLADLEKVVQGKGGNLKVIEDVLRQKVMSGEAVVGPGGATG